MSPYSSFIFREEINEQTVYEIENELKRGTKVYFFTYDPLDEILESKLLKDAKNNLFLSLYEVKFNDSLQNNFTFYDEVPDYILDLLEKYTPKFNAEQYRVEHAPLNKNIIVSAGAGTGKTTVMISRILFLKHRNPQLNFSQIGLITFTNMAAQNLRDKLIERLKIYFHYTKDMKYLTWLQELKNMAIGTIHSFAKTIISSNKNRLSDFTDVKITSFTYSRRKIIEKVIDEFNLKHPKSFERFKYIELYHIINAIEMIIEQINNHSISIEKIKALDFGKPDYYIKNVEEYIDLFEYVVKETIEQLEEHKEKFSSMDVNDLIVKLGQMVENDTNININYKYIFIDEFQDTDRVQTSFFSHIANQYDIKLFVVGDVKQSIYRFRGADYTAFDQLRNHMTIDEEFYLQHNYRTSANLLEQFNNIFDVWPSYVKSFSFTENDRLLYGSESTIELDEPFTIKRFDSKVGRVNFLKKIESTNTGVLVRTNKEVNELAQLCEENNIFYTAEQDGDFFRSIAVREFYLLIKRFTHPNNWKNRYLLHLSSYGERTLQVNEVINQFLPDRSSHGLLAKLDSFYEQFAERFYKEPVFQVIDDIISQVNPANVYANRFVANKADSEEVQKQAKLLRQEYQINLEQLIYILKKEMNNTIPTLAKVERILKLKMKTDKTMSTIYKQDEDVQRLRIMTVHKSKGLEFDQVFLPKTDKKFYTPTIADVIIHEDKLGYYVNLGKMKNYENNYYELYKKEEKIENIGEETRLLYVALTRAKHKVYVDAPTISNSYSVRNWGDLIAKSYSREKATN